MFFSLVSSRNLVSSRLVSSKQPPLLRLHRGRGREMRGKRERQRDRETERQRDERDRETERPERQRDQRDRETETQRERHRETELVPQGYETEGGFKLGVWVSTQRQKYKGKLGGLTEEQRARLEGAASPMPSGVTGGERAGRGIESGSRAAAGDPTAWRDL